MFVMNNTVCSLTRGVVFSRICDSSRLVLLLGIITITSSPTIVTLVIKMIS